MPVLRQYRVCIQYLDHAHRPRSIVRAQDPNPMPLKALPTPRKPTRLFATALSSPDSVLAAPWSPNHDPSPGEAAASSVASARACRAPRPGGRGRDERRARRSRRCGVGSGSGRRSWARACCVLCCDVLGPCLLIAGEAMVLGRCGGCECRCEGEKRTTSGVVEPF